MRTRAFLAGLRFQGRIVRSEPALAAAVFLAALVAAVLVVTGPRLLHQVSEDDLRQAVSSGEPERRSVRVETHRRIGAPPKERAPFEFVEQTGQRYLDEEVPGAVRSIIGAQHFVVESPPFLVSSFPGAVEGPFPTAFRFRYQDGIHQQIAVVDGRLPAQHPPIPMLQGSDCPSDRLGVAGFAPAEGQECRAVEVPVYEVVVTAETAAAMMLTTGDRALLGPDRRDPAWRFVRPDLATRRIILSISGIVELSDVEDDYWYADNALHRARITETADYRLVYASGIFAAELYPWLLRDIPETHFDYTWRYLVDPERLDPDDASTLRIELDTLRAARTPASTLLPLVLENHLAQRRLTIALMSTAFTGVLVVSGVAVFVLASLAAQRQLGATRQLLERGGRPGGLIAVGLVQGFTVGLAAAMVALLVAAVAVPGRPWTHALIAAGVIVFTTLVAVGGATALAVATARRAVVQQRPLETVRLHQARRLVRDASIVVVGVTAMLLLRQRSRAGGADPMAFDGLAAVAPALFGFAVGIVVVRSFGPLARFVARLAARRRGLTAFLGLRRLSGQAGSAGWSMMVVLLATGLAGFAIAVQSAVAETQEANAWQLVGADLAVRGHGDGVPVPPAVTAAFADLGVSIAVAVELPSTVVLVPEGSPHVVLLAIDAAAYRAMLPGTPTAASLLDPLITDPGPAETVPVIASRSWPGVNRPAVGDTVDILFGVRQSVEVAAIADAFPSIPLDQPFLIVDLDRLVGLDQALPLDPTVVFADFPAAASEEDRIEAIARASPLSRVLIRDAVLAASTGDPFVAWVGRGMVALAVVAGVAAVVAAVAALAIAAPVRRRELALLSAIGLRRRQAAGLIAIEYLVPTALALAAGTGLALLLVERVTPAMELDAFAGGSHRVVPTVDAGFAVGFGAAVLAAVGATTVGVVRSHALSVRDGLMEE